MSIELLLGITGTTIAFGVAITTIWQGFLTRRHNRLSVKPILIITRVTVTGEKANILIKNTGVGPAIICYIKFIVDGVVIEQNLSEPTNAENRPANVVVKKIGLLTERYRLFEFFPQESLSVGEEQSLIQSMDDINDAVNLTRIQKAFNRVSIEIEYESIYEEKFKISNPYQIYNI